MKFLNPTLLSILGYAFIITYLVARTPLPLEAKTPYYIACSFLIILTTIIVIYIDELFVDYKRTR